MIHRPKAAVEASWMQAGCARGPHRDKLVLTTGASAPKQLPTVLHPGPRRLQFADAQHGREEGS
jgi:hypothetical protein